MAKHKQGNPKKTKHTLNTVLTLSNNHLLFSYLLQHNPTADTAGLHQINVQYFLYVFYYFLVEH